MKNMRYALGETPDVFPIFDGERASGRRFCPVMHACTCTCLNVRRRCTFYWYLPVGKEGKEVRRDTHRFLVFSSRRVELSYEYVSCDFFLQHAVCQSSFPFPHTIGTTKTYTAVPRVSNFVRVPRPAVPPVKGCERSAGVASPRGQQSKDGATRVRVYPSPSTCGPIDDCSIQDDRNARVETLPGIACVLRVEDLITAGDDALHSFGSMRQAGCTIQSPRPCSPMWSIVLKKVK